jgi:hypothetical protein
MLEAGDARAALDAAKQAETDCARSAKHECEIVASVTAVRAARAIGDAAQVKTYAQKARTAFDTMDQSLEPGDRKTYEARPDVLRWRRQLTAEE